MPRMPRLGSFGTADPISRQRTRTASGSMGIVSDSSLLHRAPGSERESLEMKNMGVSTCMWLLANAVSKLVPIIGQIVQA